MYSVSAKCRPLYRPRYLPIVGRYATITRPISQLTHRSIRRPTHRSRHINRHLTDMSTDISVGTRPICRSIHRLSVGRYVDQDVDRYVGRGVHKIHMIQLQRLRNSMLFFDHFLGRICNNNEPFTHILSKL